MKGMEKETEIYIYIYKTKIVMLRRRQKCEKGEERSIQGYHKKERKLVLV